MAFLNAITCYITINENTSDFIIRGYAPNTNNINIRLSSSIELLITLKAIYSTISILIPNSLKVVIWYIYCKKL